MHKSISLTESIRVESGSHVLYFYSSVDAYIQNVVSFIRAGLGANQEIIYIDSPTNFELVQKALFANGQQGDFSHIKYVDNAEFYETHHKFQADLVFSNFKNAIAPLMNSGKQFRLWGHVDWAKLPNVLDELHSYESSCDITVCDLGFLTVCAYNAMVVPAYIQTAMMRTHGLFMTDDELVHSSLYPSSHSQSATLPSLSAQRTLETEHQHFKEKLDFVHVISHEVRNPLTVIKAYATLLLDHVAADSDREKLRAIVDYCTVIDNEISHIISTENMLSTDSFWKKRLVQPLPLVLEVIEMMKAKARTQNITLTAQSDVTVNDTILANKIGFKLIISNLLSNAIKYSQEGSFVQLKTYCLDGTFQIEVTDSGCGMTPEQMRKLFTKYEKQNEEFAGQGIGLFMVKQLTDSFGGSIHVKSTEGQGTQVQVVLPLLNQSVEPLVAAVLER